MIEVLNSVGVAFIDILPSLLVAIVFIILGYVVGVVAKAIISRVLAKMGIDEWFEEQNLLAAIGNKNFSEIAGAIVKWYLFFIFLKQAVEIVNLITLNEVLGFWIQYALLVIVAAGVIIAGMIIARFARNAIESSDYALKQIFGLLLELMVVYIAVVMGISIIGLPTQLLEMAFIIALTGIVIAVSLMIGIGFGLALKDEAKTIIKDMKKQTKKK
jgi:hypothetical protein